MFDNAEAVHREYGSEPLLLKSVKFPVAEWCQALGEHHKCKGCVN